MTDAHPLEHKILALTKTRITVTMAGATDVHEYVQLRDVLAVLESAAQVLDRQKKAGAKTMSAATTMALAELRKPASDSQRMVLSRQWLDDRLTLTPELKAYMQALDHWFEEPL